MQSAIPKLVILTAFTLLTFMRSTAQSIVTGKDSSFSASADSPVIGYNTNTAAPSSVVSNETIKRFGWFSVNEMLYSLPGFAASQDYDRRTVSFRGMFEGWNNNHMLMLMDGIPFNDNLYGSAYTWENTPLIFSKSFQVTRGPGGAVYGNNAMNGMVAFNTVEASDLDGIANVRFRFGSNSTQITDIITDAESKDAGVVASFTHYSTDGNAYNSYDLSERRSAGGSFERFKVNDNQDNHYFFAKAYGKGKYKGLSLQYHEQHWDFETGHGWLFAIPDLPEAMSEYRRLLVLQYAPSNEGKNFSYAISARYQQHGIDWNMRFFPDNSTAYGINFPNGVTELLKTNAKDFSLRFQTTYEKNSHRLVTGIEGDVFIYTGDKFHTSNIDLNSGVTPDSTNNIYFLNSWLEYTEDKPVKNIALYAQYISPTFFQKLQFNLSARYNNQFFTYRDINSSGRPEKNKNFSLLSPEASLIFTEGNIVLKAIAGKAFRTPAPTEMFGANTFTLASNINQLKAEIVTNFDIGVDWKIAKGLAARANWFLVNFQNQIAYSVANANLSTNIYTLKTTGVETELNFHIQKISGFFNYSFSKRIHESIKDSTIAKSSNKTMWAPAHLANLGVIYSVRRFYTSLSLHYQGKVDRRSTDVIPIYQNYRPASVAAWLNIDWKIAFKIKSFAELGIIVKNLTGQKQYLIKNNAAPFDYRRDLTRVFADFSVKL